MPSGWLRFLYRAASLHFFYNHGRARSRASRLAGWIEKKRKALAWLARWRLTGFFAFFASNQPPGSFAFLTKRPRVCKKMSRVQQSFRCPNCTRVMRVVFERGSVAVNIYCVVCRSTGAVIGVVYTRSGSASTTGPFYDSHGLSDGEAPVHDSTSSITGRSLAIADPLFSSAMSLSTPMWFSLTCICSRTPDDLI